MNVQEISQKAGDEWINEFEGTITSAVNKQAGNGTVSEANLGDDTGTIQVSTWDHNLLNYNNKQVSFKGKGAITKEYNGKISLKLLKVAKLNVVGDGMPSNMEPVQTAAPAAQAGPPADFVDQTLCHVMGAALTASLSDPGSDGVAKPALISSYMVAAYKAKQMAAATIREEL